MPKQERRQGTPSQEEWNGFWEAYTGVREIDWGRDEHHSFYEAMSSRLDTWLQCRGYNPRSTKRDGGAYFRGDNYIGDRTEYLEILNSTCLDTDLVRYLQTCLGEIGERLWRIMLVTYSDPYGPIFIYPDRVRFNGRLDAMELADALRIMRTDMQAGERA